MDNNKVIQRAERLIKEGRSQDAQGTLVDVLKENPRNIEAWRLLYETVTERDRKEFILKKILSLNPDDPKAKEALGGLAQKGRDVSDSEHAQEKNDIGQRWDSGFKPSQRFRFRMIVLGRRFKINWAHFRESRLAILGLVLIAIFGLMAIMHPILINTVWPRSVYDPITGFDTQVFPHPAPPSNRHLLGTDILGRDVLSRLLAATQPTFLIGLTAALSTAVVGTFLSTVAAYYRGWVDLLITNVADVFLLFPAPMIMVVIGARYNDIGPVYLGLIYGLVMGAGGTVLVMRAQAVQIASKPFMEAAKISGGGAWHIITQHLLPSIMPLAALQMMISVTGAVVADGFISFFGITRTVNNWGTLIYDAFVYGSLQVGIDSTLHVLIPAAACFTLFALGFYLVSRGLQRVANPELRSDR